MGYTYLIGWSSLDKWYYGVRFAKGCSLGDLWTKYFTSSNRVKKFRELHGEPDVVVIRQVFDDKKAAQEWERKVLQRMKVVRSPRWLNANDTFRYDYVATPELIAKRGEGIKQNWDSLTADERASRINHRNLKWTETYTNKTAEDRKQFIELSKSKLATLNSRPLAERVVNSKAGAEALKKRIEGMTEADRKKHYSNQVATRVVTFASMSHAEKQAWSDKKRKTQLAKSPEEKAAFKAKISAIKKAQWAAKKAASA